MTDERFAAIVQALGMTDANAVSMGMTAEAAEAHRQALREAMEIGSVAFTTAVDREVQAAEQASEPLTPAERLRLDVRRAVALAIEEYWQYLFLEQHQGTKH